MHKIRIILILAALTIFCFSCHRKANEKDLAKEKVFTELGDEALSLLEQSKSVVAVFVDLKYQNAKYVNMTPDLSKYTLNAERKKLIMRFGMLTSDLAYEKIIGNRTQLPEMSSLHQRFAKELNVDPFLLNTLKTYLDKVSGREITDELLEELKSDLAKNQIEIVEKLKKTDEEFLVYYTLGIMTEVSYYKTVLTDDITFGSSKSADSGNRKLGSTLSFIKMLYNNESYGEYAVMFKPMIDILANEDYVKNLSPGEKETKISETVDRIREKVLE